MFTVPSLTSHDLKGGGRLQIQQHHWLSANLSLEKGFFNTETAFYSDMLRSTKPSSHAYSGRVYERELQTFYSQT